MTIKVGKYLLSVRLVYISILLLVMLDGCKRNSKYIVSIDVYSLNWFMTTRANLDADRVINWPDNDELKTYKIKDKTTLDFISKELLHLTPLSGYNDIDTRMVCILHYSDSTTEKLQFAGTQLAMYKGIVFENDSVLIKHIEDVFNNDSTKVFFSINRRPSDDANQFLYQIEIVSGAKRITTKEDLIKELKNKTPGKNGIISVEQLSPSMWNVKTDIPLKPSK